MSFTKRLMALLTGSRARVTAAPPPPDPAQALEAARQRLKRTIEPAEHDDKAA
jgi:hypothetical protein